MQIDRESPIEPRLGLTPMVDVVLLLLIFFLLTSPFVVHSSVSVSLPEIEGQQEGGKRLHPSIVITSDNAIRIQGEDVTTEQLKQYTDEWKKEGHEQIPMYCDRKASFGTVMQVWKQLRDRGIQAYRIQVESRGDDQESQK